MRKNCRVKTIAWIMTAAMLLSVMPMTALAADNGFKFNVQPGYFVINNDATCIVEYKTKNGNTKVDDLVSADHNQEYVMYLTVYEKEGSEFPDASFYFNLPGEVKAAESGSNSDVSWVVNGRQIEFSWQGGKRPEGSVYFEVIIPIQVDDVFPLYNMAHDGNTWYRLAKTTIRTDKPYTAYAQGKVIDSFLYDASGYSFSGYTIEKNGKTYIAECDVDPENPVPYFRATIEKVEVSLTRIGGLINNDTDNPRWMNGLPDSEKYTDDNTTGGYHRNYLIKTYEPSVYEETIEQPLYNFIGTERKGNYYRLKKTSILAKPAKSYSAGTELSSNDYTLIPNSDYDFTDVILTINGKEYKYSPTKPEGKYENTYTAELDRVFVKNNIHGNANWYKDNKGWLDDAKSTFTEAELNNNNIHGFHRDYNYTLYPATAVFYDVEMYDGDTLIETVRKPEGEAPVLQTPTKAGYTFAGWKVSGGTDYDTAALLSDDIKLYAQWSEDNVPTITYSSSLEGIEKVFVGTVITLTAHISGYGENYSVQWMYTNPAGEDHIVTGETEEDYTFSLDEENCTYVYYVVVTPEE